MIHTPTVPDILEDMAGTYRTRNLIYKDNFNKVGSILFLLHGPDSSAPMANFQDTVERQTLFDLYRMIIGKLTRFAESGLTHVDSIHDLAVYAAMVESLVHKAASDAAALVELQSRESETMQLVRAFRDAP